MHIFLLVWNDYLRMDNINQTYNYLQGTKRLHKHEFKLNWIWKKFVLVFFPKALRSGCFWIVSYNYNKYYNDVSVLLTYLDDNQKFYFNQPPLSATLTISIIIHFLLKIYHNENVNDSTAEEQTNFAPSKKFTMVPFVIHCDVTVLTLSHVMKNIL